MSTLIKLFFKLFVGLPIKLGAGLLKFLLLPLKLLGPVIKLVLLPLRAIGGLLSHWKLALGAVALGAAAASTRKPA